MERIDEYVGCLSDLAAKEGQFEERNRKLEEEDSYFPNFLRDRIAIQDSKALRRLGDKTQVFTVHPNPHIRSRAIHVGEVVTTALRIATLTGLNRDLCEAIAFGHDIGHTPFGHLGEKVLSELTGKKFKHEVFGTVVAQQIEKQGKGLNLTRGTLLGIRWHSGWNEAPTDLVLPLEAKVVMMADKIAYTFADVNDVARIGFGDTTTMLAKASEFGETQRKRVSACLHSLIRESAEIGNLSFENSETAKRFLEFRKWMYDNVYLQYEPFRKFQDSMLRMTFEFISKNPFFEGCNPAVTLALMTDREVERLVHKLRNNGEVTSGDLCHFSFSEIIPFIRGREFDFTKAALVA